MLDELDVSLRDAARALVDLAAYWGLNPRVSSTVRTHGSQAELYRRYLQGMSTYPAAPPGRSAHEYGWAFDLVVTPYEALADLGATWESWGGTWGRSTDPIHFELPGASQWLRGASEDEIRALLGSG